MNWTRIYGGHIITLDFAELLLNRYRLAQQ